MIAPAIALAGLALLLLLPIGILFVYDEQSAVYLTVGFMHFRIDSRKPKTDEQKQKAKEQREKKKAARDAKKLIKSDTPEKSLREKLDELQDYARLAVNALGTLRRRMLIRKLQVQVVLAQSDPAKTGELCGYAWAAIGALDPILGQAFRIRKRSLSVIPDFVGTKTSVTARISARLLLYQLIAIAVKYGIRAIRILPKQTKQGKAVPQ